MQDWLIQYGEEFQVYLFFALLCSLLIIERFLPKRRPPESQINRWRTNAALSILAILTLPVLPLSFISAAWWAEAQGFGLLNLSGTQLPDWVLVGATLASRSFVSYATHWLNHKVPFLWRIHRVHHLDTELDVSSTVRFHPLEMPVSLMIGLPVILLLGLSPWVLILYELMDVGVTLFSHSNLRIHHKIDRFLRYLIVTPDLHKVHHSTIEAETNSNYSAVLPIWDIVLGTFRTNTQAPLDVMRLGLEEVRGAKANNFWWLLRSPFVTLPHQTKPQVQVLS
ncbi:MAG: sterol desaturase family protein [Pseudomonadales bacterium]|jgi:sterol desaturase/sphingolipid hydroxylase (fatty acid hydroxylase superfamily)|nr:sterol desaturase family protein [Pseudomonadales bacterium]